MQPLIIHVEMKAARMSGSIPFWPTRRLNRVPVRLT